MFTTKNAIDTFNSIEKLSGILGIENNILIGKIVFLDKDIRSKFVELLKIYNEFGDADFETRADMLGLHLEKQPDGTYASEEIVLSEGIYYKRATVR